MKYFYSCIAALLLFPNCLFSQTNYAPSLASAYTRHYLSQQARVGKNDHVPGYVYKKIGGKLYVSAFVKVAPGYSGATMAGLGAYTGTKAGNIWVVQLPADNVAAFISLPGISQIDLDAPIGPSLDSVRRSTRADSAHWGINLPNKLTGKNVITGIIDAGFDYNHATFYDSLHSSYRIKRVWEQKTVGTPPSGFAYGRELSTTSQILYAATDNEELSHGTHVAGIAAGSGFGSDTVRHRFRGLAFESDIVLVSVMPSGEKWMSAGATDLIDGMNYIYTYAASVGKPAVVNISWVNIMGPHDGSSLFGQACEALTGKGKILVCAAGNSGRDSAHIRKFFTPTNSALHTFIGFAPTLSRYNRHSWIDIWGDTGSTFWVGARLMDGATITDSTGPVRLADTTTSYVMIGAAGDTCYADITTVMMDYNRKPHAFVHFYSRTSDRICFSVYGAQGYVDMWSGYVESPSVYYGSFRRNRYTWSIGGDANMTVSDLAMGKSPVAVGSYCAKNNYTNIEGVVQVYLTTALRKIAPSSSLGPSADGRIKPNIAAPGLGVASSVNSYHADYLMGGGNYQTVVSAYYDPTSMRTYQYAMGEGTSAAAPAVTGIVAMMLQMKPDLTPADVQHIIDTTAITDVHTGVLPVVGNNIWGQGKINAYKMARYLASTASIAASGMAPEDCFVYPNPSTGTFTVNYTSASNTSLNFEMYDVTGKMTDKGTWTVATGTNERIFTLQNVASGQYFLKIMDGERFNLLKLEIR